MYHAQTPSYVNEKVPQSPVIVFKYPLPLVIAMPLSKLQWEVRMERLGGKLCPQCGRVEDHAHTLKRCYFSAFMFDTVRKAFGLAQGVGAAVEPSRLLLEEPLLSLQTT